MAYNDGNVSISNISANAAVWAPGEEITISFKVKNVSGQRIDELSTNIYIGDENGTAVWLYGLEKALNIAAGKSKSFSATFIIDGDNSRVKQYFEANSTVRAKSICIDYHAYLRVDGGVGTTFELPDLKVINHRFKPSVTAWNMDRASEKTVDGVKVMVKNDEGENVLTTLKLGLDGGGYDWARFVSAKLYHSEGGTAVASGTEHINLTSKINDLLSGVENDPNLIPGTYSKSYDHDFLLVFGDEFETFYGRFNLSMAFANLHLSGVSTGGACFGGFCTSKFEHPKLESYYPIRPYGGIEAVKDGVYVQELDLDSDAPFKVREDNPLQPTVRVFGHVVEIHGELQPTKKITGSDTYYPICTLPAQYAPEHDVVTLQQGSTQAIWMLRIFNRNHPEHPCKVMFSRYRDGANYADATTSSPLTWLPFHAVWCIDGSVTGDSEALAALLMDSQGYSLRDADGNDIAIMSATDEPYQLPYTGEQLEAKLGLIDTALQKSGGTMSGHLTLTETPTEDGHATPKRYVDQQISEIELTPGESAYEIAKKNGFVGSEAEWLESLHGENGRTPVKGEDYVDGTNGKSAYEYAQEGGYVGTEEEFGSDLNNAIQGGGGTGGGVADSVAWENVAGKPFGDIITGTAIANGAMLVWDGDMHNMPIYATGAEEKEFFYVSENVPSFKELENANIECVIESSAVNIILSDNNYGGVDSDLAIIGSAYDVAGNPFVFIIRKPTIFGNYYFPRAGIYFKGFLDTTFFVSSLKISGYTFTQSTTLTGIDATLTQHSLPADAKAVGEVVFPISDAFEKSEELGEIVFDGYFDTEAATVIKDNITGLNYFRVSDYAPPISVLQNGCTVTIDGKDTYFNSFAYAGEGYCCIGSSVWVVEKDGVTASDGNKSTFFRYKGTYFLALNNDAYVTKLTSDSMQENAKKLMLKENRIPTLSELILQSPDGKKFRITIDTNGEFVKTAL